MSQRYLRRGGAQLLSGLQEVLRPRAFPGLALLRHSSSSSSSSSAGSPLVHAGGPAHRRPVSGGREQLLELPRQPPPGGRGHLVAVLVHLVSRRSGEQNQSDQSSQRLRHGLGQSASLTFDPGPAPTCPPARPPPGRRWRGRPGCAAPAGQRGAPRAAAWLRLCAPPEVSRRRRRRRSRRSRPACPPSPLQKGARLRGGAEGGAGGGGGPYCGPASSRCPDCCSSPAHQSETPGSLIGRSSWPGESEPSGGGASTGRPRLQGAKGALGGARGGGAGLGSGS